MKRTRLTIAAALLVALLFTGCSQAEQPAGEAIPDEASQQQEMEIAVPEFQDFPAGASSQQAAAKDGEVAPTTVQTDLFHAKFEGDAVSGSGGAVGGKYHFIATQTDGESWHVKLEANYPTVAGRDYYVTYRFTSDVAGKVKFGDFQEFQINEGENTVTGLFTAQDSTSYLDLQLGMLQPFTIDFTEIEVKEYADEVEYENALPKPINFERQSLVYETHDSGYDTVLVRAPHAVNVNYESIPMDLGVWKSRLYVKTGVVPEPGVHYRVTADVMLDRYDRALPFEVLLNDGDVEKGYGALYGQEMVPGEVKTVEAVITGNGNGDELILQFSLGESRAGSLVIVGNVHVDKVVDHYTNALADDYALDKSIATGVMIEEQVPVAFRNIPLSPSFYTGVDTVYEQHDDGYIVNLTEGASSATMAITQAPANEADRGVWKAKLYAATGVGLEPGTSYRIQFDLDSTGNQADYEVCFDGDSENAYGALYGRSLTAGGTDHIDYLITPDVAGGPLTARIQLGKTDTASGNTVTLRSFSVDAVKLSYTDILPATFSYETGADQEEEYVSVLPEDFSYTTGVNVWEGHDDGYTQEASADGSSATLDITAAPESESDRGVWKSKLFIDTGVTPEAGKKYAVSFDIVGDKDQAKLETLFNGEGEKDYGGLYGQSLTAGESQTVEYAFTPEEAHGPLVLQFQLGETNDASGNSITVSNLKVAEVTMSDETESVLPEDFAYPTTSQAEPGYYPVSLPTLTAFEQHDPGYEQSIDGLALKIDKIPNAPEVWKSKLFVNTGIALEPGFKYKVTANVTSEKAFDLEISYNNGDAEKGYDALYGQSIAANETKDLVREFTVPADASTDNLILQLNVGKTPAGNTITVNSVKVEKYIPEHEETTPIPEGYTNVSISTSATEGHDPGYEQTLSGLELTINAVPEGQGVWKSKLLVNTGVELEAGAKYKVTANVSSSKELGFELCFSNGDDEKAYDALYGQNLAAGESKNLVHEFTVASDAQNRHLILQFQLGNSPAGNIVKVNSVTLEKWQEAGEETKTIPGAYEPVEIADLTATQDHDAGFEQSVSGTALNVTAVPTNGVWQSKLFVDTHTPLEAGSKYKVTANVTSSKEMGFELCLNNGGAEKGYDALYGQSIAANETKDLVSEFTVPADASTYNLILQFQLGSTPADNTFKVNSVKLEKWMDADEAPSVDAKSFELWSFNGYTAALGGDGSSATARFDEVPDGDGAEVWKTKLFANTGATLSAGKTYRISADVQATADVPYEICYNNDENEKGVGAQYGLTATSTVQTVTYEVTPDTDKSLVIQFSLGNAPAGTTVTVSNVKVEEFKETEGDNLMTDSLIAWAPVHDFVDADYAANLTNDDSSATMEFTSVAGEQADWKAKLYVETGAQLEAGKRYRISYNLDADSSFNYHAFYGTAADEKAVGEFYNLSAGDKQQHVVTPGSDAELILQLLIGYTSAPNKVKISNVEVEEIVTPGGVTPSINFWAHEEYAAHLSNTDSSASIDITKVPSTGREPWKVKLFAETGAELKAGKTYRVSLDVKANSSMPYDVCYNNLEHEAAFGAQYGLQASTSKGTVTYNIMPDQDGVLTLQLNLGNPNGVNTVTISNVKVEEVEYASSKSIIPNFSYDSVGYLSKASDSDYITALEKSGSSASFRILQAPAERHAWCAKVVVDTGITPRAGQGYRITFDVDAAKPQGKFEVFYDGYEELAYDALYEKVLVPGKNTFTYTIMPGDSKGPLTMQLRFGETNGTDGNTYTISNFKFEEVDYVTAQRAEIKDTAEIDVQPGYTATLKKTADRAQVQLVSTPAEGLEAWKNKLFVYTGLTLEPGQKYRVSFNVKSIIPTPFEICFNDGHVEKGIGGIFGLMSQPYGKYIEYVTYADKSAPLVVQLSLGNCTAPNTIFLDDFKVEKAGKINLVSDTIYRF